MVAGKAIERMHVLFTGRVQGVGFRFAVCKEAEGFEVTGFVRNLMNGDVELVAEGAKPELVEFLNAIRNSRAGNYIAHEHVGWEAASGTFDRFGISY